MRADGRSIRRRLGRQLLPIDSRATRQRRSSRCKNARLRKDVARARRQGFFQASPTAAARSGSPRSSAATSTTQMPSRGSTRDGCGADDQPRTKRPGLPGPADTAATSGSPTSQTEASHTPIRQLERSKPSTRSRTSLSSRSSTETSSGLETGGGAAIGSARRRRRKSSASVRSDPPGPTGSPSREAQQASGTSP